MAENQNESVNEKNGEGTPVDETTETEQTANTEASEFEVTEEEAIQTSGTEEDGGTALAAAEAALAETEDRYLRLQAELANIRRRNQKEAEQAAKYRSQKLATELLPVLDNLERAVGIAVTEEQGDNLIKGLEMVVESFHKALKDEGITIIDPLNEPFNPNFHQAVQTTPAEEGQASDTVVNVFQKGYVLHDRVLRPAMVVVAQ